MYLLFKRNVSNVVCVVSFRIFKWIFFFLINGIYDYERNIVNVVYVGDVIYDLLDV